jgi:type III secretory pathway component EscV
MAPWRLLNSKGKFLVVACCLNVYVAGLVGFGGSWFAVCSICLAALCGMMTFNSNYQITTAEDINEERKK